MVNVDGDAENVTWGKRAIPVRPMAMTGDALARNVILAMTGIGVLCLSFWITLIIIDGRAENRAGDVRLADVPLTYQDGSARSTRASKMSDLPAPPIASRFGAGWDGIQGVNALIMGPGPIGGGKLALSLIATPENNFHRIGIAFAGIPANQSIHAVAWIKAPQGTRVSIDARDGQKPGQPPPNTGAAVVDVSPAKLLASSGNLHTAIAVGPSGWMKIVLDMSSSNGVFVIYFNLLVSGNGGAVTQMIFGGIELTAG